MRAERGPHHGHRSGVPAAQLSAGAAAGSRSLAAGFSSPLTERPLTSGVTHHDASPIDPRRVERLFFVLDATSHKTNPIPPIGDTPTQY
jgi:hypothetical protein